MRNVACLLFSVALLTLSIDAFADEARFKIFDATLYANKPDSNSTGMAPITLVGVYDISPSYSREWKANPQTALPTKEEIQDLVQRLNSQGSTRIAFDFEQWSAEPDHLDDTINKFKNLIYLFHSAAPNIKVGIYNYVPKWDLWAAVAPPDSSKRKSWQSQNDRLKSLATVVDFLSPQLYTYFDKSDQWKAFAVATISEGRRIAPNKPIYPFIWPQFHNQDQSFLPKQLWEAELQTLSEHADGAIVWGGWDGVKHKPAEWNPSADWWLSTQKFVGR